MIAENGFTILWSQQRLDSSKGGKVERHRRVFSRCRQVDFTVRSEFTNITEESSESHFMF